MWMCDMTRKEFCYTWKRFMSQIWMSHVTYPIWEIRVTNMNESCVTWGVQMRMSQHVNYPIWDMWYEWASCDTWLIHICDMIWLIHITYPIWEIRVTNMNESHKDSCHQYEWVISHIPYGLILIWMPHVTHVDVWYDISKITSICVILTCNMTHEYVISHILMSLVARENMTCRIYMCEILHVKRHIYMCDSHM